MFKHRKNKKILAYVCGVGLFFTQTLPLGAQAANTIGSISDPSTGSVNFDTLDDEIGNIDKKSSAINPLVKISFSSTDNFKGGSSVTGKAMTQGFSDEKPIYYTWYLKRANCRLTESWWKTETWCEENYLNADDIEDCKDEEKAEEKNQDIIDACDADGDELITPNDWKIAATRAVIKREAGKFGSSATGIKAEPSVTDENEGWIKNFKRDNNGDLEQHNDEDAPNCYMSAEESGTMYELRNAKVSFSGTCPSGHHPACVEETTASCDVLNPDYPTTDQDCPPWIEESDPAYDPDLCTDPVEKTISGSFNVCAANSDEEDAEDVFGCTIENEEDLEDYEATLSCRQGSGTPICLEDDGIMNLINTDDTDNVADAILGTITSKPGTNTENETNGVCSALANPNTNVIGAYTPADEEYYRIPPPNFFNTGKALNESCSYLVDGLVNGITQDRTVSIQGATEVYTDTIPDGTTIAEGDSTLQPTCSFTKDVNLCKHLFPYFPEKNISTKKVTVDLNDNDRAGDGDFTDKERTFWGADSADNANNGDTISDKDETLIIGKGLDKFTWLYADGDEVGVAVEGTTFLPTDHQDSSTKIMWAFSNGTCSALEEEKDDIENGRRAFYKEGSVNILTSNFDLDRCLEENLVDPTTNEYGIGEMTIGLSANPESPLNDPGGNGDTLTVAAGIQNVSDSGSVYYEWSIEKSEDGIITPNDDTSWTDITTDMIKKYGSIKNSDIVGIGKNKINISLNLPANLVDPDGEGAFYLKIRVKATESSDSNNETTQGSITIRVRQQENKLMAYSVVVSADGEMKMDKSGGAFCDSTSGTACEVAENKIIGVELPKNDDDTLTGVSWMVNNHSMSCTSDMSEDCSEGNVLIFPVLGEPGEAINVIGKGLSKKTGGVVEVNLYFLIVEPQLTITTTDTAKVWPKLMGFFKDTENGKTADYSSYVFETNTGNEVTLRADTSGIWGYFGQTFEWSVDGESDDSYGNTTSFSADKEVGDSYSVSVVMEEDRTEENSKKINYLRKALYNNWGVSVDDLGDESMAASVQVNVVDNTYQTVSDSGKGGLFASLATNLPKQFMFLFKIVLTSFVLMFSMGIIFAVIPEPLFEKREENLSL